MTKIKWHAIIPLVLSILSVLFLNQLLWNQLIIVVTIIWVIYFWATNVVNKLYSSILLLLSFLFFSQMSVGDLLGIALSDTILLIITTQLIAYGMMRLSFIQDIIAKPLQKNPSIRKLMIFPYLIGGVLILFIPQAFARLILMGSIMNELLQNTNIKSDKVRAVINLNNAFAITLTSMFIPNGDIVLNHAAINFSNDIVGTELTTLTWGLYMIVPTLVLCAVMLLVMKFGFKKELSEMKEPLVMYPTDVTNNKNSNQSLIIGAVVFMVIAWMTESIHMVPAWIPAVIVIAVLLFTDVLKWSDFKRLNLTFLVFIVTAFSVGTGMSMAGLTDILANMLESFPISDQAVLLLIAVSLLAIVFHMIVGSSVATMSIILPIVTSLQTIDPSMLVSITLSVYIMVNIQFVLPHHHASLMIGIGENFYKQSDMLKLGLIMTVLAIPILLLLYISWWSILSLL